MAKQRLFASLRLCVRLIHAFNQQRQQTSIIFDWLQLKPSIPLDNMLHGRQSFQTNKSPTMAFLVRHA
ncbi:hypothetical protein NIES4103_62460 [Nostoc sp. NIES-4103]|nr:hypothetical protein NIES4103_62460 [Nostoc sp. NIES-4103]